MFQTVMTIDYVALMSYPGWDCCWPRIVVPKPYQAGETPSEVFARHHGVEQLLIQYGNQPR